MKQWLETLPDGYRERALANFGELDQGADSLSDAVFDAFDWAGTPERSNFWNRVYCWALRPDTRTLPPLPDENPHTAVAAQIKEDYSKRLTIAEQALIDLKEDWSSRVKQAKNLERENAELREWKRQQLQVWSDLNLQEVGDELELAVGTPIAENVLPGIRKLKAELAALKSPHVTEDKYDGVSLGEALAAYPPPESEWPEKPAPPEGCEWVRMPMTGKRSEGHEYLILSHTGEWRRIHDYATSWASAVVFRAEKIDHTEGGKYRMLEEGETVEKGDEFSPADSEPWTSVPGRVVGQKVHPLDDGRVRRTVETYENFAQQAKVILHGVLDPGNPFIDEHGISKFVDLIIKASKQP